MRDGSGQHYKERALPAENASVILGLCARRLNHTAQQGVVSVTTVAMCSGTWNIASLLPVHCNEYTEVPKPSLIYLRLRATRAVSLELPASPEAETSSCCHIPHRGVKHSHFLFPKTVLTSFDVVKKKTQKKPKQKHSFPISWDAESLDQIVTQGIWETALSICSPGRL